MIEGLQVGELRLGLGLRERGSRRGEVRDGIRILGIRRIRGGVIWEFRRWVVGIRRGRGKWRLDLIRRGEFVGIWVRIRVRVWEGGRIVVRIILGAVIAALLHDFVSELRIN